MSPAPSDRTASRKVFAAPPGRAGDLSGTLRRAFAPSPAEGRSFEALLIALDRVTS